MNLKQIAQKLGGYIQSKTQDDKGWIRQGKFTTEPLQSFATKMTDDKGFYRGDKDVGIKFTPFKAIGDFNPTGNMSLKQAFNKLPEQAEQDWGQAGLVRNNPLLQKFAPKTIEPLATAVELGPAAYMNTWSKAATTFSRDTTPIQKGWDLLGAYGSLNPAYAGRNLAAGPLGVAFNAASNKINNLRNGDDPDVPLMTNWKQGWQQGQEFQFHANPINQATGHLVDQIAKYVPSLQKFTNAAIAGNKVNPGDAFKVAFGKWLTNSGKKLLKAATLETAIETPIWATMTKTEQETYLQAVEREALQNLVMNTGMSALGSLVDARSLAPIVKNSIDTAFDNYWKYATSPEGISKQRGFFAGQAAIGFPEAEGKFSNLTDKKVRFEIDDSNSRLILPKDLEGNVYKLGQIYGHEDLYKNYPEFSKIPVTATKLDPNIDGQYDGSIITLNTNFLRNPSKRILNIINPDGKVTQLKFGEYISTKDKIKSVLIHEIQHAIQKKEGFAMGGSPNPTIFGTSPYANKKFGVYITARNIKYEIDNGTPKDIAIKDYLSRNPYVNESEIRSLVDKFSYKELDQELKKYEKMTPFDEYTHRAGEVESRDTSSRMFLSNEERKRVQPGLSQDIPVKDQIVSFEDEGIINKSTQPIKTGGDESQISPESVSTKYKTTVNIQDKNDLNYLRQILGDDRVKDIQAGKMTDWRGKPYEDIARVNIISKTPQTIEQQLAGKITDVKLKSDTFYHGTSSENAKGILTSGFKKGSELPEDIFRGGGYGKIQNSVSFAETPKEASIFSTLTKNGEIIEAKLKPNSKVVSIKGIEDANDLDEFIPYLIKQKVDAVYIGGGEKELVVINNKAITPVKSVSPESKGIKITETPKIKLKTISLEQPTGPELKQRGFSASVQEAPNVSKKVKIQVLGGYETKPNDQLMGEAKALLNEGVDLKNINRIENIDQKIAATIQEAINLDAAGKHNEAAALFNNLSELGTQVGRGTQAFSLLNKMSPEAISLSVAGKIKKYNLSHNKKLPELTGEQQKQLSKQVNEALKFAPGTKERGVAIGRVNETINSFIPSTFADKFITVWKAGLLSSLRTHERNIVGNTLMQASEQASLYPAAGADYLMSLATGKRSLVASQKGSLKGAIEGGQTAADVLKYGFDPMGADIGKYEIRKVNWGNNPLEQSLKKATDVVFNTLEAEDKVFWKSSYNRSLYNQAITQAVNEGKKGNSKYIQKLFDNATEEMKQTAFNDANYATFKDKNMLSGAIGQYKSWVNRQTGPAAEAGKIVSEMLMPFTGVPTSIVGKTIAYSPIGLVKGSVDFGRVVAGSEVPGLQRQAAQEIGRGVIGSGIFGLGAYLMSQGLMTGQAKDQKERDQLALEGKQENSIFVNGKWRSINSVGPQTLVLLAGAKANETANDPEQNLGTYGFSTLNDQLNQTFLSGVQQPLAAINDPQGNKAKSYLGGQVSSLIPNIVKDTSKAFDPLKREVDTSTIGSSILGRVQQSIPFARNKMIPQRDVLGNEIAQTPTGIGAYFDLFNSTTPISNNVVNELSRLNQAGYSYTPSKLDKDQTIGKEKMTLNQAQLDRLETVTGLATDKALNDLFNTTAYQSMSDDEKQNIVKKTVDNTRKNVRANIDLSNIQEKSYVKSSDSQLAELGGFNLFTKSVTTDPKAAMNALLTGNPIRKISDGNIVVLERENDVGSYDLGDTTSQVDHAIPLSLGGTNEVRNLQILSNEEHAIKTKTDMYLLDQVQSGKMPLKEAQEKAKKWRDTALSLPKDAQSQMIDEIDSESPDKQSDGSQVYKLVSDTGNVTLVDLGTPIKQPEYTGFDAIDKKLKSSYKSAITKRINNIVKLYEDGQLSAKEANKLIGELNTQYSSGTGTKKKSKKKITFKVTSPKALPKITLKISSPVSRVKLKSAPKIKLSKTDNRKYTIKA